MQKNISSTKKREREREKKNTEQGLGCGVQDLTNSRETLQAQIIFYKYISPH